jgi:lysylphosphatidylglycerol synthetase-like protein (DUF2156 family)
VKVYLLPHILLIILAFPLVVLRVMVVVLGGTIWLGWFSYKHLEYSHESWWHLTQNGSAPCFLYVTVAIFAVSVFVSTTDLWLGADHEELSPHRMHYPEAPDDVMLWGKTPARYPWFSLGMTPLSGLEHPWHPCGIGSGCSWSVTAEISITFEASAQTK